MSAALIAFAVLSVITIAASLGVVLARNVVHAAVFLVASLVTAAGIYVLLLADFLALVQVLIYAGAVTVLMLFALMLTRIGVDPGLDNAQKPLAAAAGIAVGALLLWAVFGTSWSGQAYDSLRRIDLATLGQSLFTTWVVPFEVLSVVLLVALVGAAVISRTGSRG